MGDAKFDILELVKRLIQELLALIKTALGIDDGETTDDSTEV